jgi:hypothetical protein
MRSRASTLASPACHSYIFSLLPFCHHPSFRLILNARSKISIGFAKALVGKIKRELSLTNASWICRTYLLITNITTTS